MTNEVLKLDDLKATNLPELQGFKEVQEALVKQYPFIEITDNATYETAKKHRTALLKGRTALESQDKLIASKLSNFRKDVKTIIDGLVAITLELENKQQTEVKRFEEIKENERIEKQRIEDLRIKTIKDKIDAIETECLEVIQKMTFQNIIIDCDKIAKIFNSDFDFEEYDILLSEVEKRLEVASKNKIEDLTEKEKTRVENERLQKEKAESDAKLKAIEDQQAKEKAEREEKEKSEKDKVFEVRKNRLAEIGIVLNVMDLFVYPDSDMPFKNFTSYEKENVYNCDTIDFENLLTDVKNEIKEAIVRQAKIKLEIETAEANIKAENLAKEKENKARIKRLAQDKKQLQKSIGIVKDSFITEIVFREFPNEETEKFRKATQNKMDAFFDELLIELENL